MASSIDQLLLFIHAQTEQLRKSSQLEHEGKHAEAKALESEWDGSATQAVYLTVDSFVRT